MQYIVRLVADGQSNDGFASAASITRFLHGQDVENALRILKARSRTDEESRWRNLRKIPWRLPSQQFASLFRSRSQQNTYFPILPSVKIFPLSVFLQTSSLISPIEVTSHNKSSAQYCRP